MKKFKISLLLSSIILSSGALFGSEQIREMSFYLGHHKTFDNIKVLNTKTSILESINYFNFSNSYIFNYDGFGIGTSGNLKFLDPGRKTKESTDGKFKREILSLDLNILIGYLKMDSNFSFGFLSGFGYSIEKHVNKTKISEFNSLILPFVFLTKYMINNEYGIYQKTSYNAKYRISDDSDSGFKVLNKDFFGNIKHEVRFELGFQTNNVYGGIFTEYNSVPYKNENRVDSLMFGISSGIKY